MELHIGDKYWRTLVVTKVENVCLACNDVLITPILYCVKKDVAWHRHCFIDRVPREHTMFERIGDMVQHTDFNIDVIKVSEDETD